MNENERTPAETAADYAVHFADGFFVPCPCCGKEVESPDNGFTSEKEAMPALFTTLTRTTAMFGCQMNRRGGIQSTQRRSPLTYWNGQSEPTPDRARLSAIFSQAAAAPAWQPLKPGGGISLSNKAPATMKRGWHGLRKQKAPFALDCKRQ